MNGKMTNYIEWESTSLEYCKLMLYRKICVVCHSRSDVETVAVARLLKNVYNVDVEDYIEYKSLKNFIKQISMTAAKKDVLLVVSDFILQGFKYYSNISKHKRSIIKRYIKIKCNKEQNVIYWITPYLDMEKECIGDFYRKNVDKFNLIINDLADDVSRKTLLEIIRCCQDNDNFHYHEGCPVDKYWECYEHLPDEVLINCGGASGDTLVKYAYLRNYKYQAIYSYEGDPIEYKKLCWTAAKMNDMGCKNINCINEYIGLEGQKDTFDERYINKRITLINMDIEGAELGVLRGAREIIKKWRPVLAVCAYHKPSDLIDIPNFIHETAPDYKIYMRKYRSGGLASFNEYVYYAVPRERLIVQK